MCTAARAARAHSLVQKILSAILITCGTATQVLAEAPAVNSPEESARLAQGHAGGDQRETPLGPVELATKSLEQQFLLQMKDARTHWSDQQPAVLRLRQELSHVRPSAAHFLGRALRRALDGADQHENLQNVISELPILGASDALAFGEALERALHELQLSSTRDKTFSEKHFLERTQKMAAELPVRGQSEYQSPDRSVSWRREGA
eukprot:CAMPEP_0170638184 /NCGR_PEP_ID=MMETSP0224-20130122/38874_1 /TAXON_ID=285029 /ORGANISM="Togula jolla, Strain CCCM 725" /LENGTH=205 /DNA_ID=CAMNT_0010968243 /DNA_START=1 /DNA_END=618 /DNA_ORIENTATION=-